MTDLSHDARVNAWYQAITGKLDALRARWATEAAERAACPPPRRRTPASPRPRRAAGPADAAQQARQAQAARELDQARQEWLLAMERAAMDVALIGR